MNLKIGDICKVDLDKAKSFGGLGFNQLQILRKIIKEGGGKVVVESILPLNRGLTEHAIKVYAFNNPVSRMLGSVSVPEHILIPTGKTASTLTGDNMNLAYEFKKLAAEIEIVSKENIKIGDNVEIVGNSYNYQNGIEGKVVNIVDNKVTVRNKGGTFIVSINKVRKIQPSKRASEICADNKDYRYDPKHLKKPEGGGWNKTEAGWSRGTGEPKKNVQAPKMKIDDFVEIADNSHGNGIEGKIVNIYNNKVTIRNKGGTFTLPLSKVRKIQAPKIEVEKPTKPQNNQWQQALPSQKKDSPYNQLLQKPEIKKMRKDISVNPNTVISKLEQDFSYVPTEHKKNLAKLYNSWLAENENEKDADIQGKIETVKSVLKILAPAKFKSLKPKITGNVGQLIRDNDLGDELNELAGFKDSIKNNPQMSDKEYQRRIEEKIRLPRNQQQLKNAFIQHMSPQNYPSMNAFNAAKQRVQKMSVSDFGKLLASINAEDEVEV